MQDYDGAYGYHPLIGAGAWPDSVVNTLAVIILIVFIASVMSAYRYGQRGGAGAVRLDRHRSIEDIVRAIRRKINIALLATGDRSFAPAREVVTTIDYYLGPLLVVSKELGGPVAKLSKALETDTKEVEKPQAHHGAGHGKAEHPPKVAAPMIFNGPTTIVPGGRFGCTPACPPTCAGHAAEPAHGHGEHGHGHGHGEKDKEKEKVPLSAKEKARLVRDELEALADYWVEARVIEQLTAARDCLLDCKLRPGDEDPLSRPRPTAARSRARAEAAAERDWWRKLIGFNV